MGSDTGTSEDIVQINGQNYLIFQPARPRIGTAGTQTPDGFLAFGPVV